MLKFRESDTAEMEKTLMTSGLTSGSLWVGQSLGSDFRSSNHLTDFDIIGQCSREIEEPENCKKKKKRIGMV